MTFCSIVWVFLDSKYSFTALDFDTSTSQIRQKLSEIHQLKDKISLSWYAEFGKYWVINFAKRQIVANGHLWALPHSTLILSLFQVGEECGESFSNMHGARCWALLTGCGALFAGCGALIAGRCLRGAGRWLRGARCGVLIAGCRALIAGFEIWFAECGS